MVHILDKFKLASCPVHILSQMYISLQTFIALKFKAINFLLVKNVYIYLINDHDLLPIFETCSIINIKCICIISLQITVISIELDFKLLIYLTEPVQVCHLLQIWFSKNHKYILNSQVS